MPRSIHFVWLLLAVSTVSLANDDARRYGAHRYMDISTPNQSFGDKIERGEYAKVVKMFYKLAASPTGKFMHKAYNDFFLLFCRSHPDVSIRSPLPSEHPPAVVFHKLQVGKCRPRRKVAANRRRYIGYSTKYHVDVKQDGKACKYMMSVMVLNLKIDQENGNKLIDTCFFTCSVASHKKPPSKGGHGGTFSIRDPGEYVVYFCVYAIPLTPTGLSDEVLFVEVVKKHIVVTKDENGELTVEGAPEIEL